MSTLIALSPYLMALVTFVLGLLIQAKFPILSAIAQKYPDLADEIEFLKDKLQKLEDLLQSQNQKTAPEQKAHPLLDMIDQAAETAAAKARDAAKTEMMARLAVAFGDKPAA